MVCNKVTQLAVNGQKHALTFKVSIVNYFSTTTVKTAEPTVLLSRCFSTRVWPKKMTATQPRRLVRMTLCRDVSRSNKPADRVCVQLLSIINMTEWLLVRTAELSWKHTGTDTATDTCKSSGMCEHLHQEHVVYCRSQILSLFWPVTSWKSGTSPAMPSAYQATPHGVQPQIHLDAWLCMYCICTLQVDTKSSTLFKERITHQSLCLKWRFQKPQKMFFKLKTTQIIVNLSGV